MSQKLVFLFLLSFSLCSAPFPLQAAISSNLDNVIVYPNPCKSSLGHKTVTFDNLTSVVRLRIYNKGGELIYDKQITAVAGSFVWGVINNEGGPIASGVYIYIITNDNGQKNKGKIAILK